MARNAAISAPDGRLDRPCARPAHVRQVGRSVGGVVIARPAPHDPRALRRRAAELPAPTVRRLAPRGIGTADVKAMLAAELEANALSSSAVRRHVLVLSVVLAAAVNDGQLARNPCSGVKLPPESAREMRFLEPGEVAQLADAITPHYRPLVLTAAYMGLRWGELAGLRVDRLDVFRSRLRIDQQLIEVGGRVDVGPPKTKAGVRTVTIPAALLDELGPHLSTRAVRASGLVFPLPSGQPMRRSNFRTVWSGRSGRSVGSSNTIPIQTRSSPSIRLRGWYFTSCATPRRRCAIAQGAHPLAIKERLGHSSITVTLDRYGGLFPSLDVTLADALDGVCAHRSGQTAA